MIVSSGGYGGSNWEQFGKKWSLDSGRYLYDICMHGIATLVCDSEY